MAAPYSTVPIAGYNTNPPSDDGSQTEANRVKWSTIKDKLNDPVKERTDNIDAAIIAAFAKVLGGGGVTSTAISYIVLSTDQGKLVRATNSGITITTPVASDVDEPFVFCVLNNSSGNITVDGNGSETIDGSANIVIPAGAGVIIFTNGSHWFTAGKNFFQAGSGITINSTTSPATIAATLHNYIAGLIMTTAGSSTTMSVSNGAANDSTNTALMVLSSGLAKTTASWAVGSGVGGLDTGSIAANTWYHFYVIQRPDTGGVDIIFSTSASAPTLPTNYTLYRRLGSGKTNGSSQWLLFGQFGDEFVWNVHVTDSVTANIATGSFTVTGVPTGVVVMAKARISNASGGTASLAIRSLLEADFSPGGGLPDADISQNVAGETNVADISRLTNTSAQLACRATNNGVGFNFNTYGWTDFRGK